MKKIIHLPVVFLLCLSFQAGTAQHFDPLYNTLDGPRTWRDSGYYFQAEIILWKATNVIDNPNGNVVFSINFKSSDESGLTYSGQAGCFIDEEDLPEGFNINQGMKGKAIMFIPQDLLFCPPPDQEVDLGLDDPYFPLSLSGFLLRAGIQVPESPIPVTYQLNQFIVN